MCSCQPLQQALKLFRAVLRRQKCLEATMADIRKIKRHPENNSIWESAPFTSVATSLVLSELLSPLSQSTELASHVCNHASLHLHSLESHSLHRRERFHKCRTVHRYFSDILCPWGTFRKYHPTFLPEPLPRSFQILRQTIRAGF